MKTWIHVRLMIFMLFCWLVRHQKILDGFGSASKNHQKNQSSIFTTHRATDSERNLELIVIFASLTHSVIRITGKRIFLQKFRRQSFLMLIWCFQFYFEIYLAKMSRNIKGFDKKYQRRIWKMQNNDWNRWQTSFYFTCLWMEASEQLFFLRSVRWGFLQRQNIQSYNQKCENNKLWIESCEKSTNCYKLIKKSQ